MPRWRRKTSFKKIDCHIHATRKQRLGADHKFRFQHNIKTLCRVPRVNRSTYYKHFSAELSPCIKENQHIASLIPHVHADYSKRLGACKITYVLKRDYGINISVGRVYRLMKQLQLPKMSTNKPHISNRHPKTISCRKLLHQNFAQKARNLVWVSGIPYIKAGGNGIAFACCAVFFKERLPFWQCLLWMLF